MHIKQKRLYSLTMLPDGSWMNFGFRTWYTVTYRGHTSRRYDLGACIAACHAAATR